MCISVPSLHRQSTECLISFTYTDKPQELDLPLLIASVCVPCDYCTSWQNRSTDCRYICVGKFTWKHNHQMSIHVTVGRESAVGQCRPNQGNGRLANLKEIMSKSAETFQLLLQITSGLFLPSSQRWVHYQTLWPGAQDMQTTDCLHPSVWNTKWM